MFCGVTVIYEQVDECMKKMGKLRKMAMIIRTDDGVR